MKRFRRAVIFSVLAAASSSIAAVLGIAATRAELVAPPPTTLLLDRQGRYLADAGETGSGLGYWPLHGVPERVAAATIAIEDQNFHDHLGVDLSAIARAIYQNLSAGRRISGASTLAMQIARMQHPGPRTYPNKILEAATACLLTMRYGRDGILEHYLRIAPYANQIHGIAHAAEKYFAKPVEDLSWAEIAYLAALPQSPSRMNPHDWRGYARAKKRAERILTLLREREVTTGAEHSLALAELAQLAVRPKPRRAELALHAILRIEELLKTEPGHPLRLTTTLDLDLQERAMFAAEESVSKLDRAGAKNGAVIVVDRGTRGVLAYVGSTGYFDRASSGAIDFARTARAAGSTLKPFIFATALERGEITPATILDDLSRGPSGITNMDGNYLGPMLPRAALGNSRNVPAARLLEQVGVERAYDVLGDLGLHRRELPASHYGVGLATGALPVTLEHLAAAYAALANDGVGGPLVYWEHKQPAAKKVFSENTARQLTSFLSDPMARLPTFPRLGPTEYEFPVAIKTGTSQGFRDSWTVAYSTRYIVAAWIGRPDAQPMNNLTGTRGASVLVRKVLEPLHEREAHGLHDLAFPPPAGTEPVRVCALSGKKAGPACEHSLVEWLKPGAIEECPVHVEGAVDGEKRAFVELAPKYARWAAEQYFVSAPGSAQAKKRIASIAEDLSPPVVVSPEGGARVLIDPETPADRATLALEARVDRSVEELMWYVDGKPFALVSAPFTARWPLVRGEHVIDARIPYTPFRSAPIRIIVN